MMDQYATLSPAVHLAQVSWIQVFFDTNRLATLALGTLFWIICVSVDQGEMDSGGSSSWDNEACAITCVLFVLAVVFSTALEWIYGYKIHQRRKAEKQADTQIPWGFALMKGCMVSVALAEALMTSFIIGFFLQKSLADMSDEADNLKDFPSIPTTTLSSGFVFLALYLWWVFYVRTDWSRLNNDGGKKEATLLGRLQDEVQLLLLWFLPAMLLLIAAGYAVKSAYMSKLSGLDIIGGFLIGTAIAWALLFRTTRMYHDIFYSTVPGGIEIRGILADVIAENARKLQLEGANQPTRIHQLWGARKFTHSA